MQNGTFCFRYFLYTLNFLVKLMKGWRILSREKRGMRNGKKENLNEK
jgi:hypothetical protein